MPNFSPEQAEIIRAIDRVLCNAARAGLILRVYEGAVFVMKAEAVEDPRYGLLGPTRATWKDDYVEQVGFGLDAADS